MASRGARPRPWRSRVSTALAPLLVLAAGLAVTVALARWRTKTDGPLGDVDAARASTGTAVFVGGALASVLLALLVLVLVDQRRRLRMRVRAALGESVELRRRFQSAFDDAPIGVAMVAPDGTVLRGNRALRTMLRRGSGPMNMRDLIHPDDFAEAQAVMVALLSGTTDRAEVELRFVRSRPADRDPDEQERTVVWTSVSAAPVRNLEGRVDYIVTHIVDRTDRREEAERLRMAEERIRTAFDHATTGIALVNPEGRYLQVNSALCRILDRDEADLLGLRFMDVRHPDDLAESVEVREVLLRGDVESETMELRFVRPSGEVVWGRTSVSAVRDKLGSVLYFLSLTEDITAERHAEEELSRRRRWFEAVVEHATDVVCLMDPNGMIRWVSPSAERVLGYGPD
jgi:PAS domain S-box-containing protein